MRGPLVTMAGYGGADTSGFLKDNGTWGQWFYTKHRYLGLQFVMGGQVHYGWARVAVALIPWPGVSGHVDRLCLRDYPQQADHHGKNERAGCHHAGTG